MKRALLLIVTLAFVLATPVLADTINVPGDYATIQGAVDAAVGGDVILIAAGTYVEQVHIQTSDITLTGAGVGSTVIQSPVTLTEYFATSANNYPVVFVDGATGVVLSDLTIDGANQGDTNVRFIGLGYWNGDGSFFNGEVLNVMNSTFSGAQHGVGVYSYNDMGGPYTIVMTDVLVDDYQKTGIALLGEGLTVDLTRVVTQGQGPTDVTAQNGIQTGFGSGGAITDCEIYDNDYTGEDWTASGLLPDYGIPVVVTGTVFEGNQTSVYPYDIDVSMVDCDMSGCTGSAVIAYASGAKLSGANAPLMRSPLEEDYQGSQGKAEMSFSADDCVFTGLDVVDEAGIFPYSTGLLDVTITNSEISHWDYGVYAYEDGGTITMALTGNSFFDNGSYAAYSATAAEQDAELNWWGDADGPTVAKAGGAVGGSLSYSPWYAAVPGTSPMPIGTNSSIQAAIDAAGAGATITVNAGTYDENITVDKQVYLHGAQAGVDARGRVATESVATVGSGHLFDIRAADVVIDGFTLTGYGSAGQLVRCENTSDGLEFRNNIVDGVAARAFWFNVSGDDIVIEQNEVDGAGFTDSYSIAHFDGSDVFDDLTIQSNDFYDGGIFAGDDAYSSTGMLISGNLFDGASMNLSSQFQNSLIDGNTFRNNGYTHMQVGLKSSTISNNIFEPCGPSPHATYPSSAFMLWGSNYGLTPSTDVTISGNTVHFNDFALPDELSHGIRLLTDIDGTTIHITDNEFIDGGMQTGGFAVRNQGLNTADASGNWWGTNDGTVIGGLFDGSVDYTPWLDVGDDVGDPGFQGDFAELWVDDDSPQTGTDGRIEEGIGLVTASTVNVLPGTYVEVGQVVIDKDVTILGDATSKPVVMTDSNTGSSGDARAWWLVNAGKDLTMKNMVLDGAGYNVYQGIRAHGTGLVEDCDFRNIKFSQYVGMGIAFMDANWTVRRCTFEDIERLGVIAFGPGVTNAVLEWNTYTGKGVGDWLDYAFEFGNGAVGVANYNTVTACQGVASSDGSTSAGILATTYYGPGTAVSLTGNVLTGNTTGVAIGYDGTDTTVLTANYNNISGNDSYGMSASGSGVSIDALHNWWGDVSGPLDNSDDTGTGGWYNPGGLGNAVTDYIAYDPWLGKAGSGNIICDPDPEYLTVANPTKTIAVKYMGGGGGAMFGYNISIKWDGSVVSTSPAAVSEGNLLSDLGGTFFFAAPGTGNEIIVDCALLGSITGAMSAGTMFTIDFTGLSVGTSDIDITVMNVRDQYNNPLVGFYEDDGLLIVDVSAPTIADVTIHNTTLSHTDDYIKDTDGAQVTATVLDDDPAFAAGDIVADLRGLGGGQYDNPSSYNWTTGAAVWTIAAPPGVTCTPVNGDVWVYVDAADAIGNPATQGSDKIISDNIAPTDVTGFDAAPGHQQCDLSWTMGTDTYLDGVVIQRTDNTGDYPLYATFKGAWPTVDPFYAGDHTLGTNVYNGGGTSAIDAVVDRNIYYYQAFCYDIARNYGGAATTARDLATNYWLGDVAGAWGSGIGVYNGLVNDADINELGDAYHQLPGGAPVTEMDIGPTVHPNYGRLGLPTPDNFVGFEDLMIFAMNYGMVAPRIVPLLSEPVEGDLALALEEIGMDATGLVELALRLEGNLDEVKGVSAVFELDGMEFVSARLSDEMSSPAARTFLWAGDDQIDLAILGTDVAIGGSGELARLTFQVTGEDYSADFASAAIRGIDNGSMDAELEGYTPKDELPATFKLVQNTPNPFNPMTTIAFNVPHESQVAIRVYDVTGRVVRTLVDGVTEPGRHAAVWDGRNDHGEHCGSGVYFCVMETPEYHGSNKMMLLK